MFSRRSRTGTTTPIKVTPAWRQADPPARHSVDIASDLRAQHGDDGATLGG